MNIESILSKIVLFEELVIESGFQRDITDFVQAVQQPQNQNLVFMKGLSQRIKDTFINLENNSLDSELKIVLKENVPFTSLNTLEQLNDLDSDGEIEAPEYSQKFISLLNKLISLIDSNETELQEVKNVFSKYITDTDAYDTEGKQALVSIIFNDLQSTGSLKEFSKVLHRWNRTLLIYHTLLKSESPDDISLVEIQNGSIDVIFNIDFDIAIDLAELIKIGLKVYGAYLLYKSKRAREIIDSYLGNKKLIRMEKDREGLMLDNIKESINQKAIEQHKERIKVDKKIDKTGIDKKADEVSTVITDHIIKGNEVKLLTPPPIEKENEEKDLSHELREETAIVRERYKKLPPKDKKLLLDKYSIKEDEPEEK